MRAERRRVWMARRVALAAGLLAVVATAALLAPAAHSLWFQALRADAGVDVVATATATATTTATPTETAMPTETATASPTATATATETPEPLNGPEPTTCVWVELEAGEGSYAGPGPYEASFVVTNVGGETAEKVVLGLRAVEGADHAARVDYANTQYWTIDGSLDAANLYAAGPLSAGGSAEVRFALAMLDSWGALPEGARAEIEVSAIDECGDPVLLRLPFTRGPAPSPTVAPIEETLTPEPEPTEPGEPTAAVATETPTGEGAEMGIPTMAPIEAIDEGGEAEATPTNAPAPSPSPPPAPTHTAAPRPSSTPRPTRTPAPAATQAPDPTGPTRVPAESRQGEQLAADAFVPPTPVPAAVRAAAPVYGEVAPAAVGGAAGGEGATTSDGESTATTTAAPTSTPILESPAAPVGQILAAGEDGEKESAARDGTAKTGYEWIGELGDTGFAVLLAMAAAGFLAVALGLGRRWT